MGQPKSEEWKAKARASWTPERRAGARQRMLGNKFGPGRKKGTPLTEKNKLGLSKARTGKVYRADGISSKQFRETNTEWLRNWHLKRRYGITPEMYAAMLSAQDGQCALCEATTSERRRKGTSVRLVVDHDHKCCPGGMRTCGRCVRGLLCDRCNSMLERLEQVAPDWPIRALAYLEKYRKTTALDSSLSV